MANRDKAFNRSVEGNWRNPRWIEIQDSKLVRDAKHVKYVLFDCSGTGPTAVYQDIRKRWKEQEKLAFLSISTRHDEAKPSDQGLVPP